MNKLEFPASLIIVFSLFMLITYKFFLHQLTEESYYVNNSLYLVPKGVERENISCQEHIFVTIDPVYFLENHKREYLWLNNKNENVSSLISWMWELRDEYDNKNENFDSYIINFYKKKLKQISDFCPGSTVEYLLIKRGHIKNYCQLSSDYFIAKIVYKMGAPPMKNLIKKLQKKIARKENAFIYEFKVNKNCGLNKDNFVDINENLSKEITSDDE